MYYLSIGDTFTPPNIWAYDNNGSVNTSIISNDLDIHQEGTYEIVYRATNEIGSTDYILTVIVTDTLALIPYYQSAEGLFGNDLLLALRAISNSNVISTSYDDARYILQETDLDPNNANNVLNIYDRSSVLGPWNSNTLYWNREHVWPQSFLSGTQVNDPHNLRPANPTINNNRGNLKFASGSGSYGKVSGGWYPGDSDKGDVARIMFYMITRYNDLTITTMGNLEMFISWHREDPVDDFELNRNEVLYSYTNNRNPFIDYPEFVSMIWDNNYLNEELTEYEMTLSYLNERDIGIMSINKTI